MNDSINIIQSIQVYVLKKKNIQIIILQCNFLMEKIK